MQKTIPVTQRDLALACKVHPSTICLALGNSPSIPLPTRIRVQEMAHRLGYQPNAAARNLAFLRGDRKEGATLPVAWINQESNRAFWRINAQGRACLEAARQRAAELGYHLDELWAHEPEMRPARLAQIVRARGVQGVLFPVYQAFDPALVGACWDDFSVVSFNDHRAGDWLDAVCPDLFNNVNLVLARLGAGGFRRVGLAIAEDFDVATGGVASSRFLRYQLALPEPQRVPLCVLPSDPAESTVVFNRWFTQHRPDAVMCRDAAHGGWAGNDVPFVPLAAAGPDGLGIDERSPEIATAALDLLADKIRRFDRGVGENPRRHLIKGRWVEGVKRPVQAVA